MQNYPEKAALEARRPGIPWTLWLSSGLVISVILIGSIMLMVTPTDSANGLYQPLVRARTTIPAATGESEETSDDEEVQRRIMEIYSRKGYSNPNPEPEDVPDQVAATQLSERTGRRTRRPLQKIGKDFDPNQSYVIKHPNGSMTYVFAKTTTSTEFVTAPPTKPNKVKQDSSEKLRESVEYRTSAGIVFPSESCTPDNPICTDKSNYPEDHINAIIGKNPLRYESFFGNDLVINDSVTTRFDNDDEFLCQVREQVYHPPHGFNKDNEKIMIVNTEDYKQGVRIEMCETSSQPCSAHVIGTTECKQFYHFRTLLAVHPKTKQLYKEAFKMPSCCKCVIKSQHLEKHLKP
ncbi:protein spaetzle [Uranotaenia lowii]|uniref:protein spaetzle n=1 Tax=Uranotaenia lowii TaxID=190385 RepID=UPI002478DCE8|nr:protein spaetzle [Uranotaenia lowii]